MAQHLPGGTEGKELQQALLAGEQVIAWAQGRGGALLVATDQRALIIKAGMLATSQMFGRKTTAWPYPHIISVDLQTTFGSGWVEIVTAGTQALRTGAWNGAWNKAAVAVTADNMVAFMGSDKAWRPLVAMLRERIQRAQQPQQAAPTQASIPDQIAALAKLHDTGVLSDDEFNAKKTELLARM